MSANKRKPLVKRLLKKLSFRRREPAKEKQEQMTFKAVLAD
jgi:hypothetical protein